MADEPETGFCDCKCGCRGVRMPDGTTWLYEKDKWTEYNTFTAGIEWRSAPDAELWAQFVQAQLMGEIDA